MIGNIRFDPSVSFSLSGYDAKGILIESDQGKASWPALAEEVMQGVEDGHALACVGEARLLAM